jgi:hypothetical protein
VDSMPEREKAPGITEASRKKLGTPEESKGTGQAQSVQRKPGYPLRAMPETAPAPLNIVNILQPWRNESITIRHLDLQQTLGVNEVALSDDVVPIEQEGSQGVNLVRAERSLLLSRHGAVDKVP